MRRSATCIFARSRAGRDRPRRVRTAFAALTLTALIAGCGTAGTRTGTRAEGAPPPGFPVTITNCGVTTTYQRPPQRVVTMNQHTTEIMLALGLADRMVGTAFKDNPILPRFRDQYRQVPVLAERYPSYETLLKAAPDFVYGGFTSAFDKKEGRSRKRLRDAGIKTFLNRPACTSGPMTMKDLWDEVRTLGTIFHVERRAQNLAEKMRAEVAGAKHALAGIEPVSVFVYDSGTKVPMTAGGSGIGSEIIRLAGGRNVFAGVDEEFMDVSWEQVIQRRPEWIVIMEYGATTVKQKKGEWQDTSTAAPDQQC